MSDNGGGAIPPSRVTRNLIDGANNDNLSDSFSQKHIDKSVSQTEIEKPAILYSSSDKGPFFVYLESTEKVGYNIGKANNIKIARDIFNLKLADVKKITHKGLNRISIEFISYISANNFVNNKTLINKGYKIFIPFNFVTSKGLARQVDTDISEQELLKCCSVNGGIEILNVKRLNRKVLKDKEITYEPTGTVLFTFRGVNLPRAVHFYNLLYNISVYISPVTQCFKCLRYGHTRLNCKGKERCFNCGEFKHVDEGKETKCATICLFCKDSHKSTSKICPEHIRQKNIKELMAYENLSFFEASEICKKTYISKDDFVINKDDFPELKNKSKVSYSQRTSDLIIEPNNRRTSTFKSNPVKRTFQQVLSNNTNKKRMIHKTYDKKAHEDILFNPNGRHDNPSQSWIHNNSSQQSQEQQPSTSATSQLHNAHYTYDNPSLDLVINFIRQATPQQTNLLRQMLLPEQSLGSYMDLDQYSDQ